MNQQTADITATNTETLVENLLDSMNLGEISENERLELTLALEGQLNEVVMDALANHLEPELMDMITRRYEQEGNTDFVLMELISESPATQIAIATGVAELRQHLVEASQELTAAA